MMKIIHNSVLHDLLFCIFTARLHWFLLVKLDSFCSVFLRLLFTSYIQQRASMYWICLWTHWASCVRISDQIFQGSDRARKPYSICVLLQKRNIYIPIYRLCFFPRAFPSGHLVPTVEHKYWFCFLYSAFTQDSNPCLITETEQRWFLWGNVENDLIAEMLWQYQSIYYKTDSSGSKFRLNVSCSKPP